MERPFIPRPNPREWGGIPLTHGPSGLLKRRRGDQRIENMIVRIKVKIDRGGKFLPAILTNEHPESSYGLPVVVVDGENRVRRPEQVYCLKVSDFHMVDLARKAGYLALKG